MNWVPVTDKVPRGPVLVWSAGQVRIAVATGLSLGCLDDACFFDPFCDQMLTAPTHWQPLPEPPAS